MNYTSARNTTIAIATLLVSTIGICNAQWIRTNGPEGGDVTAIARVGTVLFAATWGDYLPGGATIYRSDDTGSNWHRVKTTLKVTDISGLSAFGTRLFASTDSGVFVSTDSASTWRGSDSSFIGYSRVQFAAVGDEIRATTGDGSTFQTKDGGLTWINVDSTFPPHTQVGPPVSCGQNLFAITGNGVYRSTDGGESWFPASNGLPKDDLGPLAVMGNILFAAAGGWDGHVNLYSSSDFGESWTITGLTDAPIDHIVVAGSNLYVAQRSGGAFFLSADSGADWQKWNDNLGQIQQVITSGNILIAAATKGLNSGGSGIYTSSDAGKHWFFSSHGITSCSVASLTTDGQSVFAGLNFGGVSLSTNDGNSWTSSSVGMLDDAVRSLSFLGRKLFAGVEYDSVFVSTDSGASFVPVSTGLINPGMFYFSAVLTTVGQDLFAATYDGIFRWSGNSWTSIGTALPPHPDITSIVAFGPNLFATSYGAAGVIRSADSGKTWVQANGGLPDMHVPSLGANDSIIFVTALSRGVYRSTDTGVSWSFCNVGLPDLNGGYFVPSGANMFVETDSGVYLTTNNGDRWYPVNSGLGMDSTNLSSLQIVGSNVFVGTWSDGVWRRPLSEMITPAAIVEPSTIARKIEASPNPVIHATTIRFFTAGSDRVEVSIVNLLGAEVARIYSGEVGEGVHSVKWDASALAPGMYKCIVQTRGGAMSTSLVVVR